MWIALQSLPTLGLCDSDLWLSAAVSLKGHSCIWLRGPRKVLGRSVAITGAGRLWIRISEMVTLWGCREVKGEISNLPPGLMGRKGKWLPTAQPRSLSPKPAWSREP